MLTHIHQHHLEGEAAVLPLTVIINSHINNDDDDDDIPVDTLGSNDQSSPFLPPLPLPPPSSPHPHPHPHPAMLPRITMLNEKRGDDQDEDGKNYYGTIMSTASPRHHYSLCHYSYSYYPVSGPRFPGRLPVNESDPRPPTPSGGRPGPLAPRPNVPTPPPTP